MAGTNTDNENAQKLPEVIFSIESRTSTPAQLEAGKRLFKRLVARVQSSIQTSNESKQIEKEK